MDDENLDDLIDAYTTKSDVEAALEEKTAGEFVEEESLGELVKDFPKPQRELDLHGNTGSEATGGISSFIDTAAKHNLRTVRIISGKGRGIILETTEKILSSLKSEGVILSFKKEKTGGSFIVYLI